tara:strand:+ start:1075 stop:1266 length:192 start_codon:yes stop_codon:yes gene_type:complete
LQNAKRMVEKEGVIDVRYLACDVKSPCMSHFIGNIISGLDEETRIPSSLYHGFEMRQNGIVLL